MSNYKVSWKFIAVVILVLCGLSCIGQTTTVTATITDSDGQTWNNGQWKATLYNPQYPNGPFYLDGVKLTSNQIQSSGSMSSSGVISTTLYDVVNHITPGGTYYQFTLVPNASAGTVQGIGASPTGASIDLSTTLSHNLAGPRFPNTPGAYGYSSVEINPTPNPGAIFTITASIPYTQCYWNGSGECVSGGTAPPQPTGFNSPTCWGDSLTQGAGGTPYCTQLTALTGMTTYNLGIGGQRSGDIAVRANAYAGQSQQTFGASFSIPTSGSVTVTWANANYNPTYNYVSGSSGAYTAGIPILVSGYTLNCYNTSAAANTATCTPTVYPGISVPVANGAPWTAVWNLGWGVGINLIRIGRNNYSACTASPVTTGNCQVAADVAAMVAKFPANYRVLDIQNGDFYGNESVGQTGFNEIVAIDQWEAATYGSGYSLGTGTYPGTAPYYGGTFIDIRGNLLAKTCGQSDGVNQYFCTNGVPGIYVRSMFMQTWALAANINSTQTTYTYTGTITTTVEVDSEYIQNQAYGSGTVTTALRGFGGSTPAAHTTASTFVPWDNLHESTLGYGFDAALIQASVIGSGATSPFVTLTDVNSILTGFQPVGAPVQVTQTKGLTFPGGATLTASGNGNPQFNAASGYSSWLFTGDTLFGNPGYEVNAGYFNTLYLDSGGLWKAQFTINGNGAMQYQGANWEFEGSAGSIPMLGDLAFPAGGLYVTGNANGNIKLISHNGSVFVDSNDGHWQIDTGIIGTSSAGFSLGESGYPVSSFFFQEATAGLFKVVGASSNPLINDNTFGGLQIANLYQPASPYSLILPTDNAEAANQLIGTGAGTYFHPVTLSSALSSAGGVTSTTCTQWTNGLCTHN